MVLLKFLIPLFFLAYSLGEVARISFFPAVNSGIFDLLLLVIIGIWLITVKKTKYNLTKPFLLFIGTAFFSLLINITRFSSNEMVISALYLVRFIIYGGIYFVFVDLNKKLIKQIPIYMLLTGTIIMLFGFFQYFFYPSLKNLYYLGWDEHMFRLFSTFLDPNFAGAFLVLFLVFTFVLKDKLLSKKWKWFINVLMLLNLTAIVLTYSRGALLMLLVCVVTYSILTKKWKITAGLVGVFIIIFFVLSPKFYIENTNLLRFASTEARIDSSKRALNIFKENPMGVGFNTFRFARKEYEKTDWTDTGPSHAGGGVDNSFILVLVTAGILGFAAYIYLIYRILKLGLTEVKKNEFALVLVVSLCGLIVNSMFINSLFYSFLMIWIWMLLGLTENKSRG